MFFLLFLILNIKRLHEKIHESNQEELKKQLEAQEQLRKQMENWKKLQEIQRNQQEKVRQILRNMR